MIEEESIFDFEKRLTLDHGRQMISLATAISCFSSHPVWQWSFEWTKTHPPLAVLLKRTGLLL